MALLAGGRTEEDVTRMLPALEVEDVREAIAYSAWWVDEPGQPQALIKQSHAFPSVSAMLARPVPHFTDEDIQPEDNRPEEKIPIRPRIQPNAATAEEPPFRSRSHFPPRTNPRSVFVEDPTEEAENPEELTVEGAFENAETIPDESLELYHPAFPDGPTVTVSRHGLFDRRWGTNILAWSDIEAIERRSGHKHIHIILRNPGYYISAMPVFQRIVTQVRLTLNMRTFYLDTASLGIRTKDLFFTANRLWHLFRGKVHYRKKRRVRVGKKSSRDSYWQKYLPK